MKPTMADRTDGGALTLSVVLPNFNHGKYLPGALDALLSQDHPADEILVIDDFSTDDSREIVARYADKHPSVQLLANAKNTGVIATLTRGLNEARGEFIYFGAADDFVLPDFFNTAIKMLQANPNAGLFCGETNLVDGRSGRWLGVRPPVRPRFRAGFISPSEVERLLRRNDNFVATGATVFRRDAVTWAGGFDERLSSFADGYLVRKVALTFGFYFSPRAAMTWRIFPDGVSRKTSTDIIHARQVLDRIESRMNADPVFPPWYRDLFVRRWRFSTSRLAVLANPVNHDFLVDMGAQNETDRAVFRYILKLFSGRTGRYLILAWLWQRFRPFSLTGLGLTALERGFSKLRIK